MQESARCFHHLEWPPPGARLAGPVVWLRGWVVGRPGHACIDLRVRHDGRTHLGVLGLPRADLAAHFQSDRAWLPAEFIVGVPVPDGPVTLTPEVMDAHGGWSKLSPLTLTIAPDGATPPRIEGRLESHVGGTWTVRDAHHPFHGHLDDPGATPLLHHGRIPVLGWLLDEAGPIARVLATADTLVFNHLEHSLTDDALAAKMPQHAGARHARLRGAVDWPATLIEPACLRVYALAADGTAQLCFAQRVQARPAPPAEPAARAWQPVTSRSLAVLPSGRPRRLLLFVRSLLPNDATLRALDLARHVVSSHRWAARLVATEDGPLRQDFLQAGIESLVVDPAPLLTARDEPALQQALSQLGRQIRWDYLDAIAVFDPICGWAFALAGPRRIPGLFDCSDTEPLAPDPTALPAVQKLFRDGWGSAAAVCFASTAAARAQADRLAGRPAEIIPCWFSPQLPSPRTADGPLVAQAPLRTVDWLRRHHPAAAARWIFRQGPAGHIDEERLALLDDGWLNAPNWQRAADWSVGGLALGLGPLFGRGPLRPVLDAAAAGIPVIAPRRPVTEEWFADARVTLVDEANPLVLAQALLAWEAVPESFQREADRLAPILRARHHPDELLPRWARLLATVAAGRG